MTHPFSTMLLFQNRWWPEESLFTAKLRKYGVKEDRREEKVEEEAPEEAKDEAEAE